MNESFAVHTDSEQAQTRQGLFAGDGGSDQKQIDDRSCDSRCSKVFNAKKDWA